MPDMTIPIAITGSVMLELVRTVNGAPVMVKIVLDAPTQGQGFIELPASYFSQALIAQLR